MIELEWCLKRITLHSFYLFIQIYLSINEAQFIRTEEN